MKVNTVSRKKAAIPSSKTPKRQRLLDAIKKIKPGGKALRVSFKDDTELNALRNIVYEYNHKTGSNIKSSKESDKHFLYFFKN